MATAQQKHHCHRNKWTTPSGQRPARLSRTTLLRVNAVYSGGGARKLIESGTVKAIPPREAAAALEPPGDGYVMLDVRPAWEREKASVVGSVHIPLFVEDTDMGPVTLLKKWVHFGYIGLWTGQKFTMLNDGFLGQVEAAIPDRGTKLLIACGEGLRSLVAVSKLYEGGYRNLGWLAGGFNRSKDGDFRDVDGNGKLQYATIGGVSSIFLQLLILLQAVGKN